MSSREARRSITPALQLTVAERAARGTAARAEVPVVRTATAPPHRPDPVDLLEEHAADRLPELVPIRYGTRRGRTATDAGNERRHARAIRVEGFDGVKRDYYVRQLWDAKGSGSALVDVMKPKTMEIYGCASTLARAPRALGAALAISSYLGQGKTFDDAPATFAELCADQAELDYAALQAVRGAGRITVQSGY